MGVVNFEALALHKPAPTQPLSAVLTKCSLQTPLVKGFCLRSALDLRGKNRLTGIKCFSENAIYLVVPTPVL